MPDPALHLPLAEHEVLRARSPKEYGAWCEAHGVPPVVFPANGAQMLDLTIRRRPIPGGLLEVARGGCAAVRVDGPAEADLYQLLLPVTGSGRLQIGTEAVDLRGMRRGALVGPRQRHSLSLSRDWADLSVHVARATLIGALRDWTGRAHDWAPTFEAALALDRESSRGMLALTATLFCEADAGASDAQLGGLLRRWCVRLLRALPGDHQILMEAPDPCASRNHVRVAEAYMAANLSRPLDMTEVTQQVGVGLRALQKAFKKHRGERPLSVLKRLRFDRARSLLLQEQDLPVRHAAARSGLTHWGRFSIGYRQAFGESPSTTRRRAHPTPFCFPPANGVRRLPGHDS